MRLPVDEDAPLLPANDSDNDVSKSNDSNSDSDNGSKSDSGLSEREPSPSYHSDSGSDPDDQEAAAESNLSASQGHARLPSGSRGKQVDSAARHIRYDSSDDTSAIFRRQQRMHMLADMHGHAYGSQHGSMPPPRLQKPHAAKRKGTSTRLHKSTTEWRFPMAPAATGRPSSVYSCTPEWARVGRLLNAGVTGQRLKDAMQNAAHATRTLMAQKSEAEAHTAAAEATRRRADQALVTKDGVIANLQQQVGSLTVERDTAVAEASRLTNELDAANSQAETVASKSFISSLARPDLFHGNKQKDKLTVQEWLSTVNDYLYASKIANTDIQKVQFAEGHLTAEARRAWNVAKTNLHRPTALDTSPYAGITFHDFEQHLNDRWSTSCTEVEAHYKMDALQQNGSSMAKYVARFDDLCTYFPRMDLSDKIHKFITKMDPVYQQQLAIDPRTQKRWTSYDALKEYSLNHAANVAAFPRLKRTATAAAVAQAASLATDALHKQRLKKQRLDDDGFTPVINKRRSNQQRDNGAGSSAAADAFLSFKNANGVPFKRHRSLVSWLHGKGRCLCCYHAYDADGSSRQHRQHCKETPDKGLPTGYKLHNPQAN